jgi:hypothetical protein
MPMRIFTKQIYKRKPEVFSLYTTLLECASINQIWQSSSLTVKSTKPGDSSSKIERFIKL